MKNKTASTRPTLSCTIQIRTTTANAPRKRLGQEVGIGDDLSDVSVKLFFLSSRVRARKHVLPLDVKKTN